VQGGLEGKTVGQRVGQRVDVARAVGHGQQAFVAAIDDDGTQGTRHSTSCVAPGAKSANAEPICVAAPTAIWPDGSAQ